MQDATSNNAASSTGENAFADPVLWKPNVDEKTGEIKDGELEGTYVGFTPFEFEEGRTNYLLTVDTGNEEFFAIPDWFKVRMVVSMNPLRFVEGKTKVKVVFKGYEPLNATQKLAVFDLYADDVKLGKPLLSIAQLKELKAAAEPAQVAQ